jgi:hypothetical protein
MCPGEPHIFFVTNLINKDNIKGGYKARKANQIVKNVNYF